MSCAADRFHDLGLIEDDKFHEWCETNGIDSDDDTARERFENDMDDPRISDIEWEREYGR